MRILLVEDSLDIRQSTALLLASAGHEVVCASDGREALQAPEAPGCEVVLLDLSMPGMSGLDYLKERRQRAMTQTPVIILSAYVGVPTAVGGVDLTVEELASYGVVAILPKPTPIEILLQSIKEAKT